MSKTNMLFKGICKNSERDNSERDNWVMRSWLSCNISLRKKLKEFCKKKSKREFMIIELWDFN